MENFIKYLILEEINKILIEQNIPEPKKEPELPKENDPIEKSNIANSTDNSIDKKSTSPDNSETINEPSGISGSPSIEDDNLNPDISTSGGPMDTFGLSLGGGGGFSGGSDSSPAAGSEDEKPQSFDLTPPSKPMKNSSDPVGAAIEDAKKIASQTSDVQQILNAVKASIQVNFGNYKQALPIINQLRNTKDKTLNAVADRLTLFIAGI